MSKLFMGSLPPSGTDSALKDFVSNACFQIVSAMVVRVKLTGVPRGFGFVGLAEGQDL